MFWVKAILKGILVLVLIGGISIYLWKQKADNEYLDGYNSLPAPQGTVLEKENRESSVREKVTFQTGEGESIPALFHYPRNATGQVPCVVMLYGIGMKMDFLDKVGDLYTNEGFAIICPEQYGRGDRKPSKKVTAVERVLELRTRGRQTILEARWVLDFLATRKEIDPKQTYLLGISLGAILGTSALAVEPRYQGGILMWGGGNVPLMLTSMLDRYVDGEIKKFFLKPCVSLLANLFDPAEPLLRIEKISPRPLLFQFPKDDELIPKECADQMVEKAGEPKDVLWYECGHEKGLTEELVRQVVKDQVQWLKKVTG